MMLWFVHRFAAQATATAADGKSFSSSTSAPANGSASASLLMLDLAPAGSVIGAVSSGSGDAMLEQLLTSSSHEVAERQATPGVSTVLFLDSIGLGHLQVGTSDFNRVFLVFVSLWILWLISIHVQWNPGYGHPACVDTPLKWTPAVRLF